MKISNWLKPAVLSVGIAFSATSAQATVLALPTSNAMSTGTYNSFEVYSLDLLEQCAAAGDSRCLPSGPFPVQSSPGVAGIADQPVVLTSSSGYGGNITSPFAAGTSVDNAFMTPTGNQSFTFEMTASGEPGGTFAGDTNGRWEVRIGDLRNLLGTNELVFLFDNNQSAAGTTQFVSIWAQARIVGANGDMVAGSCFEVSALTGGCADTGLNPTPANSDYLLAVGDFCVDKVTGASYNIGGANNANSCPIEAGRPKGGYYVSNNLSTSVAEFAAFNQTLNNMVMGGSYDDYFLQLNVKYFGNDGGAEQLWICSACNIGTDNHVSEPAALALLGAALMGGALVSRRRSRQA